MKIAFIGSGNVATFYSKKFAAAGHEILQIMSSTLSHAQELAKEFGCEAIHDLTRLTQQADVYILAMNDNSVKRYNDLLHIPNKTVIHTAGSIALNELSNISQHVSCIWCLYSIKKESLPTRTDIPVFINSTTSQGETVAKELASAISTAVNTMDDEKKLNLHLAAVLVNNYTNHLAAVAANVLNTKQIPFHYLLPILQQTVEKLDVQSPLHAQTGPALRRDTVIMEKHVALLENHPEWQALYRALAESIQRMYPEE
jgi:predicted short-subunit dehydrogenase-like oxidoreductase (DUF2520 family)